MLTGYFETQINRFILSSCTLLGSLLLSLNVQALGLGEVSSRTHLGEPLQATIAIIQDRRAYEPSEVKVRQLGIAEATKLGIDLVGAHYSYRLTPVTRNGQLAIQLTSRHPITEPFLDMVVELKWPTGKTYREYTLLVDPVTVVQNSAPSSSANAAAKPTSPQVSKNSTASKQQVRSVRSIKTPALSPSGDRYRVQSGDSLSKIAYSLARDSQFSSQQMMQWLLDNNPQAFTNGNINKLLAGAKLKLPAKSDTPLAETGAKNQTAALVSAPNTNRVTSQPTPEDVASAVKAAEPVRNTEPEAAPQQALSQQQLKIVTPNSESGVPTGQVSESLEMTQLRNKVAATNELVDKLSRDNQVMRKRLEAIENGNYLQSLEELVLLKEQQVIQLKQQLNSTTIKVAERDTELAKKDKELAEKQQSQPAASSENAPWLVILLIIALIGAVVFFLRWRSREPASAVVNAKTIIKEGELLDQLDSIVAANKDIETYSENNNDTSKQWSEIKETTEQAYERVDDVHSTDRRPENIVKASIKNKTQQYVAPELAEFNQQNHDALDQQISEAIEAANLGAFDIAETILNAARLEFAAIFTDTGARIDLAQEFIEQLRQT